MNLLRSYLRTDAGAGIVFAVVMAACLLVLHFTASPCELPDGTIDAQCDAQHH